MSTSISQCLQQIFARTPFQPIVGRHHGYRRVRALVLVGSVAVSLLFAFGLFFSRNAHAHDAAPVTPPLLPACHVADLRCVSSAVHHAPFRPGAAVTETRPADGKWLRPMPSELTGAGTHRSSTPTALNNVQCENGFADVFACSNIDLLAYLPIASIGGQFNNDMWGWVDPVDGTEYALVGARDGVIFLDLSTPTAPRYLGKLPSHGTTSNWRDLKVYRDHVYIVADYNRDHGLQIFDLTQLRNVTEAPVVFQETAHYGNFSDAHNIAIGQSSGTAYAVGGESCQGGLHMIDIQPITMPVQAGCYTEDGYIHDTQCVIYRGPDQRYRGREICINAGVQQMTVVDVTDKRVPQRIGRLTHSGSEYIHQGWLTADHRFFLLNDEMDEWRNDHNTRTYIIDLTRLDAPELIGSYTAPFPSIDHNLYVSDTYIYEANYTSGLRILDAKEIARGHLQEVAGFDTFPEHDDPIYAGAWSAYPYYPSGIAVVSTIERGVFVLQPKLSADAIVVDRVPNLSLCQPISGTEFYTTTVTVRARNGYTRTASITARANPTTTAGVATVATVPLELDLRTQRTATGTLMLNTSTLVTGANQLTLTVEAPDAQRLDQVPLQVHLATNVATAPALIVPTTTLTASRPVVFDWTASESAHQYRLEIATDADFTEIIFQDQLEATTYLLRQPLQPNHFYHWRVTPLNGCGEGMASAATFRTANQTFLPIVSR